VQLFSNRNKQQQQNRNERFSNLLSSMIRTTATATIPATTIAKIVYAIVAIVHNQIIARVIVGGVGLQRLHY
jgi:hypothetical protein